MRRLWVVTGTSAAAISVAFACSTFDSEPSPATDDGGTSDGAPAPDAPTSADGSAGDGATDAERPPSCITDAGLNALDGGCAELLATGQDDPRYVVAPNGISKGSVLWTTFGTAAGTNTGTIMKADDNGANPTVPPLYTALGGVHILRLTVHGSDMFWGSTTKADETTNGATVSRRRIAGGAIATILQNIYAPRGIAVTDTDVFVATRDGILWHTDYDGNGPVQLSNGKTDPQGVDVDLANASVFVALAGNDAGNPGNLQGFGFDGGIRWSTPVNGTNHTYPWGLEVGAPFIFWSERGDLDASPSGTVNRAQREDGGGPLQLCYGEAYPTEIAISLIYVYFLDLGTSPTGGQLRRAKKDGSSASCEVLATGLANPGGIDFNAPYVYWTTRGDGRVWRMKVEN